MPSSAELASLGLRGRGRWSFITICLKDSLKGFGALEESITYKEKTKWNQVVFD